MERKEMKMFYDWSVQNSGSYSYQRKDDGAATYFVGHDGERYIREYGYRTIAELKTELSAVWSKDGVMEEMIKPVAVAAMKGRPKEAEGEKRTETLDEFIYIF